MGNLIAKVVDEVTGNGEAEAAENKRVADDALNALIELADSQYNNFYQRLVNDEFAKAEKLVPIDKITESHYKLTAKVSNNVDDLKDDIGTVVGDFAAGAFKDALVDVAKSSLNILFGSYSGSVSKHQDYIVSVGPLGGLYRIDYYLYSYRFQSQKLHDSVKNVLLTSLVVSSVDVKELTRNTVNVIVQSKFGNLVDKDGTATDKLQTLADAIWQRVLEAQGHRVDGPEKKLNFAIAAPTPTTPVTSNLVPLDTATIRTPVTAEI